MFNAVFSSSDISALKHLSKNKDLIISKPDKGRGVVLLDKDTYVTKVSELISYRTKFQIISESIDKYTRKMEDKLKIS